MTPLFIYMREAPGANLYLVRGATDDLTHPGYKLIASIEARVWLQSFLNYEKKDRDRMILELEEGRQND
jgi:hypothetical protein